MADRQLYRSRNAFLGGVCAGVAQRIDADAIVVRIFAILLTFVTFGLAVIAYAMLWARLPLEPEGPEPFEVMPESAESNMFGAIKYGANGTIRAIRHADAAASEGLPIIARLAVAVGLMLLFLVVSFNVSPLVPGTQWWQFWPIAFMIVGLCLIVVPMKSRFEAMWHAMGIALTSLSATVLPVVLEIVEWDAVAGAFSALWPAFALALVAFAAGFALRKSSVVIGASVVFAAFCLVALYMFALPVPPSSTMALAIRGLA